MDLFIMRHGQAYPSVTDDASRELTAQGIKETHAVAQKAFTDKHTPTKIIASTYTRAIQTADVVADVLDYNATIPTTDLILPDSDPYEALAFLAKQKTDSLLIVSHQSFVGKLISLLVDGVVEERHVPTSAIARIKFDEVIATGCGHLKWLKTP
jgi:phosphohistidine phosphatase